MDRNYTNITVNYTDLINEILINDGHDSLFSEYKEKRPIKTKSIGNARSVIQSALATYYNIKINGKIEALDRIDQLPQYEHLRVSTNYDLEKID